MHDWHLRPEGRAFVNNLASMAFADDDITFVPLDDFEAVTLELG